MTKHTTQTNDYRVPPKWDASQVPSLAGKVAIVTGANSGIGFATAKALVASGGDVVLACRNEARGLAAVQRIRDELSSNASNQDESSSHGRAEFLALDVSSLASVRAFVEAFTVWISSSTTPASWRSTQLFGLLQRSDDARIVCVTSLSHRNAKFQADELVWPRDKKYNAQRVYANTKLFNLLFAQELDRRLKARGVATVKVSASHPGFTATNIMAPTMQVHGSFVHLLFHTVSHLAQMPEMGILPTLYAATAPNMPGGLLYGPEGFHNMWGHPTVERPQNAGVIEQAARVVWDHSERLAKTSFPV